jgi:type II secretory pathway pseudopilin PulG
MNLPPRQIPAARAAAFTMVEIAISLAIIGFALVAIIGILPLGMGVQRENREETIINQEAAVWFDAIRSGARGLDDLTNAVFAITNFWTFYEITPSGTNEGPSDVDGYTYRNSLVTSRVIPPNAILLTNGFQIVGLLSTPKYVFQPPGFYSNHIVAYVRSLSGLASEKYPQDNLDVRQDAFSYRLIVENVPPPLPAETLTNQVGREFSANLRELRLSFRWPLLSTGRLGNNWQTFRTQVGGVLTNEPLGGVTWFFQPQTFARAQ